MDKDGGLRTLFRLNMPTVHWQSIESPLTGNGTPDQNGCENGVDFWVEHKFTATNAVKIDSFQVAWHERRIRCGGTVFLAVRRISSSGPRKGEAVDSLYLYNGMDTRKVFVNGLSGAAPILLYTGGPPKWDWAAIKAVLTNQPLFARPIKTSR